MRTTLFYPLIIFLVLAGCRSNYYTQADFQTVPKIDSHVHINNDNGVFVDQALKDNFRLITLEVDHSDSASVSQQHTSALNAFKKYPGIVYYGATFFFDTAGWGTENWNRKVISHLEKEISDGAVSVKLWKNIGMTVRDKNGKFIMIDDPLLKPVIDFIKRKNMIITAHLGEPRNCWLPLDKMTVITDSSYFAHNPQYHMFLHPEYPSYEDQINARDNFLRTNPDIVFIGCHLGSLEWDIDSLAKRLDEFPSMAVDMSARICHLQYQSAKDREKVRNFCIKYQDRLLYGTDTGSSGSNNPERFKKQLHKAWLDDWNYFTSRNEMTSYNFKGKFIGLELPKNVVKKIYSTNAEKWYRLVKN
jgi:predicted TIM-barrel fold metal-dependent hydrolase